MLSFISSVTEEAEDESKLWAMIRSLFSVLEFDSMYRHLESLYQLQLE